MVPRATGDERRPCRNMSSVDEHHYRNVLELTPPVPTQPLAIPSAPATMGSVLTTIMPTTPTKGGTALLSRPWSAKKWDVRRQRGTSSTPSEAIGMLILFFQAIF
jgi:hypothetical protein